MPDRIVGSVVRAIQDLRDVANRPTLSAVFLSVQARRFSPDTPRSWRSDGIEFEVLPHIKDLLDKGRRFDVCILASHNSAEEKLLFALRRREFASLYCLWFWDNHHHHIGNLRIATLADIIFVSHWQERWYLGHPCVLAGAHVPACAKSWSTEQIDRVFPQGLPVERKDALFGGFGEYNWLPERNTFLEALKQRCTRNALTLGSVEAYFASEADDRLRSWAEHKVHIAVPVADDLSTRIFDSLLVGQIPLVPDNVKDLDSVIPKDLQDSLPILRYRSYSVESAADAWRQGLIRFDADRAAGIERRRRFVSKFHGLPARLSLIATTLRKPPESRLAPAEDGMITWRHWR